MSPKTLNAISAMFILTPPPFMMDENEDFIPHVIEQLDPFPYVASHAYH
jgi:hypothetical protein